MTKHAAVRLRFRETGWLLPLLVCALALRAHVGWGATPNLEFPASRAIARQEFSASSYRPEAKVLPMFPTFVGIAPQQRLVQGPLRAVPALKTGNATAAKGRLQIGVRRSFDKPAVVNSKTVSRDEWVTLPNGWRVWSIAVSSKGALGIRVHLVELSIPPGVYLLAYSATNPPVSIRPLTSKDVAGRRSVWTQTIFAEEVMIECQVPPEVDLSRVAFSIPELSHIYALPKSGTAKVGTCENDVTCYPDWAREASGTARMLFVDSGNTYLCSGCLLSANDVASGADYFLTANHCIGDQTVASTLELFWFYQTAACNGTPPALGSVPHTAGGAELLAGDSISDFAFLRLRRAAPSGAAHLGWTTAQPSFGANVASIHHPGASYKRISFGREAGTDGSFWEVRWNSGVTEPGSSGGPLFDSSHQVVGQLYGGNSACTAPDGIDVFGRFDLSYDAIKAWIDPYGTGAGNAPPTVAVARGSIYHGLFHGAGVSPLSSGAFVLTTGAKRQFTASVRLGRNRYALSGRFDTFGAAEVRLPGKNLTIDLQIDPKDTDNLSGQVSGSGWSAALTANRATFNARLAPSPLAGRYTVVFSGGSDPAREPSGTSFGAVVVSQSGRVRLVGKLADGTAVSQTAVLSKNGEWPLYLPLYSGQGLLFSWVNFGTTPGDVSGEVTWTRPARANDKLFVDGFTIQSPLSGAPYIAPGRQKQALNFTSASLVLDGVNPQSLSFDLVLTRNGFVSTSGGKVALAFSAATGLFSGRVLHPSSSTRIPFAGVLLQNRKLGAGFYKTASQAGPVWLRGQ